MLLFKEMDRNEIQQILIQLNQALYNHYQWYNDLIRTLVCRLPCDKHDILPEAYKECRFGQWYYKNISKKIVNHPGFVAIGKAHKHMHQLVGQILIDLDNGKIIAPLEYDNFANSLERLRLEIDALKTELETLLYNRDPLTMAYNRTMMLPILREQLELSKRYPQSCCIAMVDIDSFKKINDLYGHLIGDKILTLLVHRFIEGIRPYDKIFRYGGEEFVFCIPHVDLTQAFELIDRIRKDVEAMPFKVGLQDPIHITVSCGITMLNPKFTIEQSIDHADKALYRAKSNGKNQTQIWVPETDS